MSDFISKIFSKSFILQFIKFGVVGALGTIVNISILYFLTEFFNLYYIISEIFAFSASVLNNYILNKLWTFKENIKKEFAVKYIRYTIICLLALIINLSILIILVEFFSIWYIFAEILAIMGSFLINFIGNKLWTFNQSIKTTSENF